MQSDQQSEMMFKHNFIQLWTRVPHSLNPLPLSAESLDIQEDDHMTPTAQEINETYLFLRQSMTKQRLGQCIAKLYELSTTKPSVTTPQMQKALVSIHLLPNPSEGLKAYIFRLLAQSIVAGVHAPTMFRKRLAYRQLPNLNESDFKKSYSQVLFRALQSIQRKLRQTEQASIVRTIKDQSTVMSTLLNYRSHFSRFSASVLVQELKYQFTPSFGHLQKTKTEEYVKFYRQFLSIIPEEAFEKQIEPNMAKVKIYGEEEISSGSSEENEAKNESMEQEADPFDQPFEYYEDPQYDLRPLQQGDRHQNVRDLYPEVWTKERELELINLYLQIGRDDDKLRTVHKIFKKKYEDVIAITHTKKFEQKFLKILRFGIRILQSLSQKHDELPPIQKLTEEMIAHVIHAPYKILYHLCMVWREPEMSRSALCVAIKDVNAFLKEVTFEKFKKSNRFDPFQ